MNSSSSESRDLSKCPRCPSRRPGPSDSERALLDGSEGASGASKLSTSNKRFLEVVLGGQFEGAGGNGGRGRPAGLCASERGDSLLLGLNTESLQSRPSSDDDPFFSCSFCILSSASIANILFLHSIVSALVGGGGEGDSSSSGTARPMAFLTRRWAFLRRKSPFLKSSTLAGWIAQ